MGENMLTLIVNKNEISDLSVMKLLFQNIFMYFIREECLLLEEIFWVKNQEGLIYLILEAQERLHEKNMMTEWEKCPNRI